MDASLVASFFARSGPALQKVVDEIAAKAVDQAVAAMVCMLEQFREEMLAPNVAWLQLERRVQELEAAAAEQGARQSRQAEEDVAMGPTPAAAPRAVPQAPTPPWQDAVPWKSPPVSLRNMLPPPPDVLVPFAQPGSSDAVRCKSPPAWLRNVPPPPPDGPVPFARPGPAPPPPPPPGQPVLEKAPPTKAPPPPLPADAIPRWEALASTHARWSPAAPCRQGGQSWRRPCRRRQ